MFDIQFLEGGEYLLGAARGLLIQGVAALLNAAHPKINYPLSQTEIINRVNAALATMEVEPMLTLTYELEGYNTLGSDICCSP